MAKTDIFAKILVFNESGQILLLRRSKTAPRRAFDWEFPGGVVEPGEDPKQASLRELEEEAGLISKDADYVIAGNDDQIVGFFFWTMVSNKNITLSFEHDKFNWISVDDALEKLTVASYKKALRFYIDEQLGHNKVRVSTKCILSNQGNILILKRSDDDPLGPKYWDLPGGGVEPSENLTQTMERELLEETGLRAHNYKLSFAHTHKHDGGKVKIRVGYLAEYSSGEIQLSDEHSDYKWVPRGDGYDFAKHNNWPGWGEFLKQFG